MVKSVLERLRLEGSDRCWCRGRSGNYTDYRGSYHKIVRENGRGKMQVRRECSQCDLRCSFPPPPYQYVIDVHHTYQYVPYNEGLLHYLTPHKTTQEGLW